MRFLSNHSFSAYLWTLSLVVLLGLSPVQNISASVSSATNMKNTMHHQMNGVLQKAKSDSNNAHDCCDKNECASSHCAGIATAVITSTIIADFSYTVNSIYKAYPHSLTHTYPSSLYRPPKI
jgi:hypothetical protein